MSVLVIGDVVSRLRQIIKAERQDSFITDRYLYQLFKKHAALVMKRLDEKGRLMAFNAVFETLDFVELEEVDKVEASCLRIKSYSTFMRTKESLPIFTEGAWGPMVRSITSLSGDDSVNFTTLDMYNLMAKQSSFRYNKEKYCWYLNDRFYFPNINWPAVRIEGIFEDDISRFKCNSDEQCLPRQQQSLNVPDYILADVEKQVLQELGFSLQVPSDSTHDAQNPNR